MHSCESSAGVTMIKYVGYTTLLLIACVYPWALVIIVLLFLAEYDKLKGRKV